jgi:DNA-binding CsgD family transcriptional regulator
LRRSRDAVLVGAPAPSLVARGRSPDADLVYRTVLTFGPATADELRKDLGLPARRIGAALDELAAFDAVSRHAGASREGAWAARPPAEVLSALRRRRHTPAPVAPARPALPSAVQPLVREDTVRHLPSRAQTRLRLAELMALSRHEHLAMNPEQTFDPESVRSGLPMDRMVLGRGVRMRVVGVQPAGPDLLEPYGHPAALPRPDYRVAPAVPMKLIIIDRKVALFPIDAGNIERGYLEMGQQPVVTALASLFEQHWASAHDPWARSTPQLVLTPREQALIALLAQGLTDSSAARRLHIGPRTVTSIMRGLMDRFGVDNRFQLGLVLGALRAAEATTPSEATNRQEQR